MKKLFNHTKRPERNWEEDVQDGYDWDEETYSEEDGEEYYAEDEEYTGEEDGEEYYAEDEEYTGDEGGEEYYAEDEEYTGEEDGEEYYAEDEEYTGDEDGEEYYAEDEESNGEEDGEGYYAEDEEYTGEEDGEEYYAEDEEYTGEEDGEEYYAEDEESTGEEDGGEYYAEDEEYTGEEDGGEYYADDDNVEDEGEEYYADDEDYEAYEEDAEAVKPRKGKTARPKQGKIAAIWTKFLNMSTMDRIMTATGVAVLVLAIVTGSVYASARAVDGQVSEFVSVGTQLDGIQMIGEQGLLAVADAQMARIAAANAVEEEPEEQKEYDEAEYTNGGTVELELVSVQKDLKIKFNNKKTGKLISNVPFSVTITDPNGKTETWTDDDMDGIIYKKGITPGNYSVAVNALTDEKYKDYTLPTAAQKVEVKKDIAYKKVDVSNEIKKESEINAAKEDTQVKDTVVESTLQDTVQWVASTATSNTYVEVSKSTITDPMNKAYSGKFLRMAEVTPTTTEPSNPSEPSNPAETEKTPEPEKTTEPPTTTEPEKTTEPPTTTEPEKTTEPATPAPTPTVTPTPTPVVTPSPTPTVTPTPTPTVTPTPVPLKITLDKKEVTIYPKSADTVTATVSGTGTVSAVSSDTNIATVAVNGKAVTVTGVKEGTVTVTVTYTETTGKVSDTFAVKVKASNPKEDTKTLLKDNSGQQLFVSDGNGGYREAAYADYYKADKFYVKGAVKYTGWQTLDGKLYFFTADGNKVTGEQVIQGAKYNFASDGSLVVGSGTMGIDVSKWNGSIDWNAVKNSGVSYVIIRVGYRGSSQGALIEDPKFRTNIKGATSVGLKVGVYFFTQAVDEVEAVQEASMVLDRISGYKISYPVFLDVEGSGGRGDQIDSATRTAVCKAFCNTIQNAGYTAGVYANKTWLSQKMDAGALSAYKIWLAQYAAAPTYSGRYDLWQYKSNGKVSGISGNVDLNLSYLGY